MKTFVFAYDRYDTLTTPLLLESAGIDHIVLCHTDEQKEKFIKAGRVNPNRIIATGAPKGLAYNRNKALDMMSKGEWACFLVDDYINTQLLEGYRDMTLEVLPVFTGNTTFWGRKMYNKVGIKELYRVGVESMAFAERLKVNLVGFAGYHNPLFRKYKWKINALADGRCWFVRKTELRFDERAQMIDDVSWCAINIEQSGGVLINQWLEPLCSRYTAGGFGTVESRLEQRKAECAYLVGKHKVIRYGKKKGWPPGSHIKIRSTTRRINWNNT